MPKYRSNFNLLKQSGSLTVYILLISHNVNCCILPYNINYRLIHIYRVIREESARLQEMIVCEILSKKVHMNMGPILNGYGVMTA